MKTRPVIIIEKQRKVTQIKKVPRFLYFYDYAISCKQVESSYGKKELCKQVVRLSSFLIVWILDIVNVVFFVSIQTQNECTPCTHKKNNLWIEQLLMKFLRKVNFILLFFQEDLASLLNRGKTFSNNLGG